VKANSETLSVNDTADLSGGAGKSYTFSLWVKPATVAGASDHGIFCKGTASTAGLLEYFLEQYEDDLYWYVGNATTASYATKAAKIAAGVWSHIICGFDASTGLWHRRESQGLPGWRIGHLERWNGKWIAGDIYGGGLYELAWDAFDEAGDPLVCQRTSGVFSDAQNRLLFSGLELVMDTGSRDSEQKAVLQYSDDGGRNWTNWREGSMGSLGAYAKRIRFHRLGSSRARVWRIRCSDPRRRDLLSASVTVESAG
jgi:hypothetical protein